jgi:membrane fusion protein (multidrug efflux system)
MTERNKRRYMTVILAAVIIIGSFILKNVFAAQKVLPEGKEESTAVNVSVVKVKNTPLKSTVAIVGKLNSKLKFDVFSEVTGKLQGGSKAFKEGVEFKKGEVLLGLDNTDSRLNLYAQKSSFQSQLIQVLADIKLDYPSEFEKWKAYSTQLDPEAVLNELPVAEAEGLRALLAARNIYNQYYSIRSMEAQLRKFTIYAPFTGVVSEASVNPNTIVRAGQKIGTFLDPNNFELEAGISPELISLINIGDTISLVHADNTTTYKGSITRISKNVDPNTQTAKVYIGITAQGLYEGMYLSGTLTGTHEINGIEINHNLLLNDGGVFIVENEKIKKVPVHVASYKGESVIVKGLPDNTLLINRPLAGAVEGKTATIIH